MANPEEHGLFGIFLLVFVALVHFADALFMFNRIENAFLFAFLYGSLFAVVTLQTMISPYVSEEKKLTLVLAYLAISLYSFFIPFIKGIFFFVIPAELTLLLDLVIVAIPAWVVFLYWSPWSTEKVKILCAVYFFGWFVLFGVHWLNTIPEVDIASLDIAGYPIQPALIDGYGAVRVVIETGADAAVRLYDKFLEIPKDIGRAWERQIKIAAGDYYIGSVDQNAQKLLGVFMEKFKPEEKVFYLGEEGKRVEFPVKVSGAIRGQSLELENCEEPGTLYLSKEDCLEQQTLYLSCNVKEKKITGKTNPETMNLYDIEGSAEGVDCEFGPSQFALDIITKLLPKTELIQINAQFPFTTKAYLKTYFMDELRKREMRRANIDIFSFYKLPKQQPIAVYTGGPVMIGIGIEQDLPLAVAQAGEQRSTRFGITLENRWKGEIESIGELRVIPPAHIELVCPAYFVQEGNEWLLKEEIRKREGSIKTLKTFNCRIKVKEGEGNTLLENFPLVESYFKMTAKYKYKLSTEVLIKLKAGDGAKSELGDCITFCSDPDGCYCKEDCKTLLSEVVYGKNCNGEFPKSTIISKTESQVSVEQRRNDTGAIFKESDCPKVKKCDDYTGLKSWVCEDDPCKLRPGNCYYNYASDECLDCPPVVACGIYTKEACAKDSCKFGCKWATPLFGPPMGACIEK